MMMGMIHVTFRWVRLLAEDESRNMYKDVFCILSDDEVMNDTKLVAMADSSSKASYGKPAASLYVEPYHGMYSAFDNIMHCA